jgi:DnaJ-class molecular chaperone
MRCLGRFLLCLFVPLGSVGALRAQEVPAGTPDQITHYRISRVFDKPEQADPSVESAARNSTNVGACYAALLLQLHRMAKSGSGYEATYRALIEASGPTEHLRALAAGLKAAIYCTKCKEGKIVCNGCKGKKRIDMKCPTCDGKGRLKAAGGVKGNVTQRCNKCSTTGVIKDVACAPCLQSGEINCTDCLGTPWRDRPCSLKECKYGRVRCPQCQGTGMTPPGKCSTCDGKKRVKAPGDAGAGATMKCRTCDARGVVDLEMPCATCAGGAVGAGFIKCTTCQGLERSKASLPPPAKVFRPEPCPACQGKGWPEAGKAVCCGKCLGLGVRMVPAADPAKTLP